MNDITRQLREPFPETDIEWRVARAGEKNGQPWAMVLAYVTSRAVMERLDTVFGVDGWYDEYEPGPSGGVLCKLYCRFGDQYICKQDVADNTNFEAVKGGVSGALKRAAVKFGVGRYLYGLHATFVEINKDGIHYQPAGKSNKTAFKWNPPALPAWAIPELDRLKKELWHEAKKYNLDQSGMRQWIADTGTDTDNIESLKTAIKTLKEGHKQ